MTQEKVIQELKRIRAASHARPIQATENDISRLIANLERCRCWPQGPDDIVCRHYINETMFPSYTLTSLDIRIEEMP